MTVIDEASPSEDEAAAQAALHPFHSNTSFLLLISFDSDIIIDEGNFNNEVRASHL
jgi:hypothetical protein